MVRKSHAKRRTSPPAPAPPAVHRLNTHEAAQYLGLSPGTLRNWHLTRTGPPYYKIGRRCIYDRADLETFMQKNRIEAGQ
jgi:hypothetical protein